ncbi:MAG: hypothetical protein K9M99_13460 [Candidatus Cloacimonetes bacterium]|nr:hypothetical protein [Candidatus Cloacimonadota bacterium]
MNMTEFRCRLMSLLNCYIYIYIGVYHYTQQRIYRGFIWKTALSSADFAASVSEAILL